VHFNGLIDEVRIFQLSAVAEPSCCECAQSHRLSCSLCLGALGFGMVVSGSLSLVLHAHWRWLVAFSGRGFVWFIGRKKSASIGRRYLDNRSCRLRFWSLERPLSSWAVGPDAPESCSCRLAFISQRRRLRCERSIGQSGQIAGDQLAQFGRR